MDSIDTKMDYMNLLVNKFRYCLKGVVLPLRLV
jgi:hypothetical protein